MNKYVVMFIIMNMLIIGSAAYGGWNLKVGNWVGAGFCFILSGGLISIRDSVFMIVKTPEQMEGGKL